MSSFVTIKSEQNTPVVATFAQQPSQVSEPQFIKPSALAHGSTIARFSAEFTNSPTSGSVGFFLLSENNKPINRRNVSVPVTEADNRNFSGIHYTHLDRQHLCEVTPGEQFSIVLYNTTNMHFDASIFIDGQALTQHPRFSSRTRIPAKGQSFDPKASVTAPCKVVHQFALRGNTNYRLKFGSRPVSEDGDTASIDLSTGTIDVVFNQVAPEHEFPDNVLQSIRNIDSQFSNILRRGMENPDTLRPWQYLAHGQVSGILQHVPSPGFYNHIRESTRMVLQRHAMIMSRLNQQQQQQQQVVSEQDSKRFGTQIVLDQAGTCDRQPIARMITVGTTASFRILYRDAIGCIAEMNARDLVEQVHAPVPVQQATVGVKRQRAQAIDSDNVGGHVVQTPDAKRIKSEHK